MMFQMYAQYLLTGLFGDLLLHLGYPFVLRSLYVGLYENTSSFPHQSRRHKSHANRL